ncbi:RF-1 domain-containing protein [Pseudomassariella vexata]|uniref:RF-1 domain-domain-containing protein n=1 Tax=Pseudomassariella vexata TaxID=1141098 RepID=A0A1Y2EJ82_9PEZI|nr:RF-1 domain-containing protein [Pseudomassariella vexata]ORY71610.1 RF-1 domain-domain-containing protein [Pseudomassariella vexata]
MLRAIVASTARHAVKLVAVPALPLRRNFSTVSFLSKGVNHPPRPKPPPETEIDESFLKGSGPGGQKINKTNSAVQLIHRPSGLVIKCQETRSRSQNRKIARQLLADKLDDLTHGDQSRAAIVSEFKRKKRASSAKKSRRKYRKLEDEKKAGAFAGEEEQGEESEGEEKEGEDVNETVLRDVDESIQTDTDEVTPEVATKVAIEEDKKENMDAVLVVSGRLSRS